MINDDEEGSGDDDAEVLSMVDESDFNETVVAEDSGKSKNDKIFGMILIMVAIIGNYSIGDKIREKIKGR